MATTKKTTKKAKKTTKKVTNVHESIRIPEGMTKEQLEDQTTAVFDLEYIYSLKEEFDHRGFKTSEFIKLYDRSKVSFSISFPRYYYGKISQKVDTVTITSHQMLNRSSETYYQPLQKGEFNVLCDTHSVWFIKQKTKAAEPKAIVDSFVDIINQNNRMDLWEQHFTSLKNVYSQDWRRAKESSKWVDTQDYITLK